MTLDEIAKAVRLPVSLTIPNSSAELITAMNTGKPVTPASRSEFAKQLRKWAVSLGGPAAGDGAVTKRAFSFWK